MSMTPAIPTFYLYGDVQVDADIDTLHVEPVRERSLRHDWIIHPHLHPDHVQFVWISEGGAQFVIEGQGFAAVAPCVVVQPAGALHEIRFEPGTEGRVITAAISYVETVARDDPRLIAITRRPCVYPVAGDSSCAVAVPRQFDQILTEAHWEAPGRRMAIRGCFLNILVSLLRLSESAPHAGPSHPDRNFELVTRYRAAIEQHFRAEKSLQFYAHRMGVSAQRLNAACRARAGHTASEVLYNRILIEAKRCLLYTEMTVAEIGHSIGFDDPAYFNRFFSKRTGTPPGAYRAGAAKTRRVGV